MQANICTWENKIKFNHCFSAPNIACRGVPHGGRWISWMKTHSPQLSCSLSSMSVESILLDPNWRRMLIGLKLTLCSCQNTFKSFHAAMASWTNMSNLPTGSITFHFIQEPCFMAEHRQTSWFRSWFDLKCISTIQKCQVEPQPSIDLEQADGELQDLFLRLSCLH